MGSQRSLAGSNASGSRLTSKASVSRSDLAMGTSASPCKIKQAPKQEPQYLMARSLICGIGTLEPQPLEEGGASFEANADLAAPFDKYTGLLSQRMAADDDGSNQESLSPEEE